MRPDDLPPPAPPTRLVRPRPLAGSTLVRDYLRGDAPAQPFFNGSPFLLDSFRRRQAYLDTRFGPRERQAAARCLRPTSPTAQRALTRFVQAGGAVVTTGQQAGFLTGPLLTIYKALSAVRLARHLEASLAIPVLPVFWIASDDHDWAEVNHTALLDRQGRAVRLELPPGDSRPLPMSVRPLPEHIEGVLDQIGYIFGHAKYTEHYLTLVRDAYGRGGTVAAAFGKLLGELLGGFDLCLVDAGDPALKEGAGWVLRQALEEAEEQERLVRERTEVIEGAGYPAQVRLLEGGTNVFRHDEEVGRERLYRFRGRFMGRETGRTYGREAVLREVASDPVRFSGNVLLRPVVESAVLPTLGYVGGPAELGYFAQVGALFEAFGMEGPVVVPRFSGLVVEPEIERLRTRVGLEEVELARPRDQLIERVAREAVPEGVRAELDTIRTELVEGYRRLIDEAVELDPTLEGALGAIRNRSLAEAGRAERKVLRAIKRREGIELRRLIRVLEALRPLGREQERTLNVLTPLVQRGPEFLDEVAAVIGARWRVPADG